MQVELAIIKFFLNSKNYQTYCSFIRAQDFPDELQIVFNSLCNFHNTNDGDLDVMDLANLVFANNPKDKEYYQQVFETLSKYVPVETTVVKLIDSLKRKNILQKVSIAAYEESEGKKDIGYTEQLLEQLKSTQEETKEEFVSDDLEVILNETVKQPGLRWRLECLNKSLGSLRKGDFGFIFARPESGKTTFLASEVSKFLGQTEQPVLWIN